MEAALSERVGVNMINLKGLVSRFLRTRMLGNFLLDWGRTRDGGVAVTVAVMTPVLVGVLAIAIDFGRATNLSTELDNAADAYALAGATQLDQSPGSCVRAIQAAVNANLVNTETFASNPSGSDVYIDSTLDAFNNSNIRFMERINKDANGHIIGDYIDVLYTAIADCDANAQHIEVFIDRASPSDDGVDPYRVGFSFAGIIGAATETFPKGYAIAESADLTCGFLPMMICPVNPLGAPVTESAQDWYNNHIASYEYNGYGLWLKAGEQSVQWGAGNFGWLRVGNITGAKDLGEAIGMVNPPLLCVGDKSVETEPGSTSGARQAFNTRMDIWEGSAAVNKSNSQWQPAPNQVKGQYRKNGGTCNTGGQGYNDPDTPYAGPGTRRRSVCCRRGAIHGTSIGMRADCTRTCRSAGTRCTFGSWAGPMTARITPAPTASAPLTTPSTTWSTKRAPRTGRETSRSLENTAASNAIAA